MLRRLAVALIVASMAAGIFLAVLGRHTLRWAPPPVPPRAMAVPAGLPAAAGQAARAVHAHRVGQAGHPGRPSRPRPMPRSRPVSLAIPAIHVHARVISLGQAADGAPAVPSLSTRS